MLDERHARLGAEFARFLERPGWTVSPEVTFSVYGERGSIDLLAWHPSTRALLVIELKSELTSVEETLRRLDVKVRLAPRIAAERFGWRAATIGRLQVFPNDRTARRKVAAHSGILDRVFHDSPGAVRRWLRQPSGPMPGSCSCQIAIRFVIVTPGEGGSGFGGLVRHHVVRDRPLDARKSPWLEPRR
jgi:hypothetical protein